jgi:predicted MFS family arabinose efflux permease
VRSEESTPRRLILFVGGVFAVESGFFAVVPPLIPRLVHDVHLTTTEVGVLVAAYPAGVLLGAMPSIAMVDRRGVRMTTLAGLGLLVVATLGFAWGTSGLMLDSARLLQGFGGAVAWAGALAWLTSTTSVGRRGAVIGGAVGAALIGMVLGPALGAVAAQAGRGPVFSALAVVLALLAFAAPMAAPASSRARGSTRALLRLLRNRQAAVGNGILVAIGVVGGTVWSLTPLLVVRLHGGPAIIAWILAGGYLLGALLNVFLGRLTDRLGRLAPTVISLVIAAPMLPLLPLFNQLAPLVITSILMGAVVAGLWTPTAAMVTDGADPGASGHAVGVALMNAAWAAGGAAGAVLMARLADVSGFVLPFVLAGALFAVSALVAGLVYRPAATTFKPAEPVALR